MDKRDTTYDYLANICHELVMAIRKLNDEKDFDIKYADLSDEEKNRVSNLIKRILYNPEITAKKLHNEWIEEKAKDGWIYGEKTDRDKKIHACMVEYEQLNFFQQLKDKIFIETVKFYIEYWKQEFLNEKASINYINRKLWNNINYTRCRTKEWLIETI
jgi:hypothetical protein